MTIIMLCHSELSEESVYMKWMYTDSSLSSFSPKISPISLHSCHQMISIYGTTKTGCRTPATVLFLLQPWFFLSPLWRGLGGCSIRKEIWDKKIPTHSKELILFKKDRIVFQKRRSVWPQTSKRFTQNVPTFFQYVPAKINFAAAYEKYAAANFINNRY